MSKTASRHHQAAQLLGRKRALMVEQMQERVAQMEAEHGDLVEDQTALYDILTHLPDDELAVLAFNVQTPRAREIVTNELQERKDRNGGTP